MVAVAAADDPAPKPRTSAPAPPAMRQSRRVGAECDLFCVIVFLQHSCSLLVYSAAALRSGRGFKFARVRFPVCWPVRRHFCFVVQEAATASFDNPKTPR